MYIYVLVSTTFFSNGSTIVRAGNSYKSFNEAWEGLYNEIDAKLAVGVADIVEKTTKSLTIREYTVLGDRTVEYVILQSYLLN